MRVDDFVDKEADRAFVIQIVKIVSCCIISVVSIICVTGLISSYTGHDSDVKEAEVRGTWIGLRKCNGGE